MRASRVDWDLQAGPGKQGIVDRNGDLHPSYLDHMKWYVQPILHFPPWNFTRSRSARRAFLRLSRKVDILALLRNQSANQIPHVRIRTEAEGVFSCTGETGIQLIEAHVASA